MKPGIIRKIKFHTHSDIETGDELFLGSHKHARDEQIYGHLGITHVENCTTELPFAKGFAVESGEFSRSHKNCFRCFEPKPSLPQSR